RPGAPEPRRTPGLARTVRRRPGRPGSPHRRGQGEHPPGVSRRQGGRVRLPGTGRAGGGGGLRAARPARPGRACRDRRGRRGASVWAPLRRGGGAPGRGGGGAELLQWASREVGIRAEAASGPGDRQRPGGGYDQATGEPADETERGALASRTRRTPRRVDGDGRQSRVERVLDVDGGLTA